MKRRHRDEFALTRSNLLIAVLLLIAGAVACFVWAARVEGIWDLIAGALASAAVSIAVALLITDVFLKPVFTRDLLHVAGLQHRFKEIALEDVGVSNPLPWSDLFASSTAIRIVMTRPSFWFDSHWTQLREAARQGPVQVELYLPNVKNGAAERVACNRGVDVAAYLQEVASVARKLEESWKAAERHKKASLTLYWLDVAPVHAVSRFDRRTVLSVQPPVPTTDSSPLSLYFGSSDTSDVGIWLTDAWSQIVETRDRIPAWTATPTTPSLREQAGAVETATKGEESQ